MWNYLAVGCAVLASGLGGNILALAMMLEAANEPGQPPRGGRRRLRLSKPALNPN